MQSVQQAGIKAKQTVGAILNSFLQFAAIHLSSVRAADCDGSLSKFIPSVLRWLLDLFLFVQFGCQRQMAVLVFFSQYGRSANHTSFPNLMQQ